MLLHWRRLGHELSTNPNAPPSVKLIIAKAARELQDFDPPTVESGGNPAAGVDRPDPTSVQQPRRRLPVPNSE